MTRPLILCIISMVFAIDAIYGRRLLQDDDSEEDLYTKYAIGDYDEELAKRKRTEAEEIMQEGAGTAIAIIVMVVVCIGFLAVVGAVIYCICCLPCCVIASRNRREGQVCQRTTIIIITIIIYSRCTRGLLGRGLSIPARQWESNNNQPRLLTNQLAIILQPSNRCSCNLIPQHNLLHIQVHYSFLNLHQ